MAHWEMAGWLILVLGWVFVPFYSRSKVFTMPEFLENRYCPAARSFLSVISLVSYVLTKVAVTVYAGGMVFKSVLGIESWCGIDFFWIGAIGLVVLTGLYTVLGGMKAVLYTSVLQMPILLLGSATILVVGLSKLGGWGELERICGSKMTLVYPASHPDFPWTGVIFGVAIVGFWYFCTDQYMVQRVLSARNQKQARRGTLFGAYLKLLPVFIFMVPGMIAYALNQKGLIDLKSADAAFPTLVSSLLPVGMKGIVVGGLVAALMSSLASLFNSSAILFTVDFYKKYRPQASEKRLVAVGRTATTVIVILGILWIPVMKSLGNALYLYLQDVQSLIAPGISATFCMGVFFKRTTPIAGLTGLVFGFVVGLFRLTLNIFRTHLAPGSVLADIQALNWLHFCVLLFLTCVAVIVIVSIFTRKVSKKQIQGLTFGSASPEQIAETRKSWNAWDVIHTTVILAVIATFYWYFW